MRRICCLFVAVSLGLQIDAFAQQGVLLIVLDDVGVANIGTYRIGLTAPPTPNIDRLARRGVLFRNAWSNPMCSPTRACIQTGRYSFRTGVGAAIVAVGPSLQDQETTIPELFPQVPSAAFGKWHLGSVFDTLSPNRHGYQQFQGEVVGTLPSYYVWPYTQNGQTSVKGSYAPATNVDDALAWIGSQTGNWFAQVSFNSAHTPFHNPPPPLYTVDIDSSKRTRVSQYKAAIQAADGEIARLLTAIDLTQVTVILVGDNGTDNRVVEPPFERNQSKGSVYQGGVWVPLIIAGCGVVEGGREVNSIVHVADLFATIADLMGATQTTGVDAVSLVPYLQSSHTASLRETMYCEIFGDIIATFNLVSARAIRDQRFKLLQQVEPSSGNVVEELYDLVADPYENQNLILDPLYDEQITFLRDQMNSLAGPSPR